MAVPALPTATGIVTEALEIALLRTPTAAMITKALNGPLQYVKADLMLKAPTHPNLLVTATSVTTRGQQRYSIPSDHNIQQSITLLDGPDVWRGIAQAGSSLSITLAASLSSSDDELTGKYIIITGDPGIEEYRQILAYNNSTKVVTVDLAWNAQPSAGSTYLICSSYTQLFPADTDTEFDRLDTPTALGTPTQASLSGQEFLLYPIPDKSTYGLINRYWSDISLIDESSDLFVQLLREWRSIWVQGVVVKSMQRYDEDRYQNELSIYNFMLDNLVPQTCRVTPVRQQS